MKQKIILLLLIAATVFSCNGFESEAYTLFEEGQQETTLQILNNIDTSNVYLLSDNVVVVHEGELSNTVPVTEPTGSVFFTILCSILLLLLFVGWALDIIRW